jgi:hypothetical protein
VRRTQDASSAHLETSTPLIYLSVDAPTLSPAIPSEAALRTKEVRIRNVVAVELVSLSDEMKEID